MYINTQTMQYPVSEGEIRAAYPNTSFAVPFVAPEPYAWVFPAPQPTYDPITQGVREVTPVQVNGNWQQAWEVFALDAETVSVNQVKAKADLAAQYDHALAKHLDTVAQSKRYDNRVTCALRAGYSGPFQAEGQAFAAWMDACNATAYQWWAEIEAGTKPMFASTDEFIAALPQMVWPALK